MVSVTDYGVLVYSGTEPSSICIPSDYRPEAWTFTTTTPYVEHTRRFNCSHCGAPNQIDVCEYCGSAYEDS